MLPKEKTNKKTCIPSFWEWYVANTRGYMQRGEEPYSQEEGREVYDRLVREDFDFPHWN